MKNMRYDQTGKDLICMQCRNKELGKDKTMTATEIAAAPDSGPNSEPSSKAHEHEKPESDVMSYQCGECNFGFTRKKDILVNDCPYCGKSNVRLAFRDSAQKLIEEAEWGKYGE